MSINNHEKYIQEKLQGLYDAVDTEDLWSHIAPHIVKRKKRNRRILLFCLFPLIVAGITIAFLPSENSVSESIVDDDGQQSPTNISNFYKKKLDVPSIISSVDAVPVKVLEAPAKGYNEPRKHEIILGQSSSTPNSINELASSYADLSTSNKYISDNISRTNIESLADKTRLSKTNSSRPLIRNYRDIPSVNTLSNTLMSTYHIKPIVVLIKPQRFRYSLGVKVGSGFVNYKNTSQDPEKKEYINLLDKAEKSINYFSIGGVVKLRHQSRWFMETGLSYSRLTSQTVTSYMEDNGIIVDGTQSITIDDLGQKIVQQGPVNARHLQEHAIRWHTYHHKVHIPFTIGYDVSFLPLWTLSPKASLHYNIITRSSGGIVSPSGNLQKFEAGSVDNPYDKGGALGYGLGLSLRRFLKQDHRISLDLYYQKNPNIFSTSLLSISREYSVYGLRIGMEWTLK